MRIPLYQVDAFTNHLFGGNPAAVCPLEQWLEDDILQNIAAENNLSETAYFVARKDGYELRWFTPEIEMDLCGHATLASAHVLFEYLGHTADSIKFVSPKSGELLVTKDDQNFISLNFPTNTAQPIEKTGRVAKALGAEPIAIYKSSRDLLALFGSEDEVLVLQPDFELMKRLDGLGLIATAKGDDVDFVCRFFGPKAGIYEDPVTGSAYCTLAPFWSERLDKKEMNALQLSKRRGNVVCKWEGDRVLIKGKAVTYMIGEIIL